MSMSSLLSSPLLLLSFFLLSTFPCLENINFLFPGNFNCLFKNFDDSALCVSNKPILWGLLSCETKTVMPSVTPSCVLQLFEEGMMANQPIVTSTVIFIFQKKKKLNTSANLSLHHVLTLPHPHRTSVGRGHLPRHLICRKRPLPTWSRVWVMNIYIFIVRMIMGCLIVIQRMSLCRQIVWHEINNQRHIVCPQKSVEFPICPVP